VVPTTADRASVYQVAAVRREQRRLAYLLDRVPQSVHADIHAAILLLGRAAAELVDELEHRE
jgi:hypothetical protein